MLRWVADERPNVDLDVNLNLNATVDVDVVGPNIGVEVFTAARATRAWEHDQQRQRVLPAVRFTTKQ